ncbi:hypothetical protein E8E15_000403 [Penicillium rubens]|jgi:hypothetical protein|nr:uncharacterized protein N7525_005493 [Penicillium rubens]KAF3016270.1 hypothetical protein E8E15_000403 [Penicillium rubens]KAJ5043847.1 hypothetical protein NUH16_000640 [Penicillium rubens]KAJ5840305.1 hypothetical protein N7525_005493 [Penicillium rubens]KAJ5868288.1 hypothetical protein N7534_002841 [Penicillium rubens]
MACVLDEEKDDRHIEYFQGYKQFYERGLPGQLPAGIEESILESDELAEIRSRIGLADVTGNKDLEKYEALVLLLPLSLAISFDTGLPLDALQCLVSEDSLSQFINQFQTFQTF